MARTLPYRDLPSSGDFPLRTLIMRLLILSSVICLGYACWHRVPQSGPSEVHHKDHKRAMPVHHRVMRSPNALRGNLDQDKSRHSEKIDIREETETVIDQTLIVESQSQGPANSETVDALPKLIQALSRSLSTIEAVPAYTVTLEQQVQKKGRLLDPDIIDIKLRRSPFSVYLKWQDDQQEVLFVEGLHNGRMLAHPTRGLTSIRRIWRITPESAQAMRDCRYPVTEIGIEKLSKMALNFYEQKQLAKTDYTCTESRVLADGRPAMAFDVVFSADNVSPEYASSRLTFDSDSGLLVGVENHAWGDNGRPGLLLELYRYHGFTPNLQLDDKDFSEHNPEYHFVK